MRIRHRFRSIKGSGALTQCTRCWLIVTEGHHPNKPCLTIWQFIKLNTRTRLGM